MKTHYTAKEIAVAMGITERAALDMAKRGDWPSQKRPGRGGPNEYPLTSLPSKAQKFLAGQHLDTLASDLPVPRQKAAVPVPITAVIPELTALTKHQVVVMDARVWFMRLIEQRPAGQSIKKTNKQLAQKIAAGEQPYAQ
ncbi:MAG: hypothetical protein FIA89_14415, partial [Geobacter sp.]|nr:hypothetical protein [Geobacter sp.]